MALPATGYTQNQAAARHSVTFLPLVMVGARPTATPSPTPSPDQQQIAYLNGYRSQVGLPALVQNSAWSTAAAHHSRYMVQNNQITHVEDPTNPWYTADGAVAGRDGDVFASSALNPAWSVPIDNWLTGPFHALWILYPDVSQIGYGTDAETSPGWIQMAATLQLTNGGSLGPPNGVVYPIEWPGNGSTVSFTQYDGGESPDPLTACPGYTAPSGLPLIVQFTGSVAHVTSSTVSGDAGPVAACAYDQTTYTNPDPSLQATARAILAQGNAVVVIPSQPLAPGGHYTVTIVTTTQTVTWSFQIAGV